jgi:hypothetical protein
MDLTGFRMKKYLTFLLIAIFMYTSSFGQPQVEEVAKGLYTGDISRVIKYFDKMVDITILNDRSTYSKTQAEMVLRNFFSKNTVRSFQMKYTNGPKEASVFVIGELVTINGTFRVYIFFRQKDKQFHLREMRFEQ